MRAKLLFLLFFCAVSVFAQEVERPTITVKNLPPEPIAPCKSSPLSGYLQMPDGRTKLSEKEVGHAVLGALKIGYTVTVYPTTNRGVFVNYECSSVGSVNASERP
jgi:hypothetical protein